MSELIIYLVKVNLCLACLVILYLLAFRKVSFFRLNRFYLLLALVFSFVLPQFELPFPVLSEQIVVSDGIMEAYSEMMNPAVAPTDIPQIKETSVSITGIILLVVSFFFILKILLQTGYICWLVLKSEKIRLQKLNIILHPAIRNVFSVFNLVFCNRNTISEERWQVILKHEKVHYVQGHTLDLILFDMAAILLWMNPFFWICRHNLKLQHEYLADRGVVLHTGDVCAYLKSFIPPAVSGKWMLNASAYNQTAIQKRILMLTKRPSTVLSLTRYFLVLPLVGLLAVGMSCTNEDSENKIIAADTASAIEAKENIPSILPVSREKISYVTGFKFMIHPVSLVSD